ncbi:GntR family transcriptional regulator [Bacteroidota bacterium]
MKKESQANRAYIEIRRVILTAQLHPRTRLKEDHWARKLSVSRIAIREALTRLLGEGLVTAGDKGGYFVVEMTIEDVRQIRETREILETAAVRLAIHKISQKDFNELDQICEDFSDMVKKGYLSGANEVDLRFHEKLIELSGNKKLLKAYHFCHIPIFHQKLGNTSRSLNDYDQTDVEHRGIVTALKDRNLNLAEETLIKHFKRGEDAIISL